MNTEQKFTIGEASEKVGLPESTIRYYDRQFSDYLSLARGKNNQRLFTEENLKDLEYIRYLLKRENFTVQEVKEKLAAGEEIKQEKEEKRQEQNQNMSSVETGDLEVLEEIVKKIENLDSRLKKIEEQLNSMEENQGSLQKLLDMNLERYNRLVDELT